MSRASDRSNIEEIDRVLDRYDPDAGADKSRAEQVAEIAARAESAELRAASVTAEREKLSAVIVQIDLAVHSDSGTNDKIRDVLTILAEFHKPKEIPF